MTRPPRRLVERVEAVAQHVEGEAAYPGPPVPSSRALVEQLLALADDADTPLPPLDGIAALPGNGDELRRAALRLLAAIEDVEP